MDISERFLNIKTNFIPFEGEGLVQLEHKWVFQLVDDLKYSLTLTLEWTKQANVNVLEWINSLFNDKFLDLHLSKILECLCVYFSLCVYIFSLKLNCILIVEACYMEK